MKDLPWGKGSLCVIGGFVADLVWNNYHSKTQRRRSVKGRRAAKGPEEVQNPRTISAARPPPMIGVTQQAFMSLANRFSEVANLVEELQDVVDSQKVEMDSQKVDVDRLTDRCNELEEQLKQQKDSPQGHTHEEGTEASSPAHAFAMTQVMATAAFLGVLMAVQAELDEKALLT